MASSKLGCAFGVVGDITVVVALGVCSILLRQLWTPYQRGFFKDDESLMYPLRPSTVDHNLLYGMGFSLPTAAFLLIEGGLVCLVQKTTETGRSPWTTWLWNVYRVCLMFYYGAVVTRFTTDASKYTIGRLRPHFFAVCEPDFSALNSQTYVQGDFCQGNHTHRITEARISFPSGHSSISSYCMVFLVIYLQKRFSWQGMLLLKSSLQTVCLLMALFTCLSRVSDYKHHWSDVLAGGILGALVAVFVFWSAGMSCLPSEPKPSKSVDQSPGQVTRDSFHSGDTISVTMGSAMF